MSTSGSSNNYGAGSGAGTDQVQSLMIDVRASTAGFAQDLATMRSSFNSTLVDGFTTAGSLLDTGLTSAISNGTAGFTNMRTTALGAINDIATQANASLFSAMGGASGAGAGLMGIGNLASTIMGLPGRATGGAVSPGQAYLVGEQGPEMFVPTSAGSVTANQGSGPGGRDVRVAINVNTPAGSDTPQSLQRSSRQIASAVRRAIIQY